MKRLLFCLLTFVIVLFAQTSFASNCASASVVVPRQSLNQNPVNGTFSGETFSGTLECAGSGSQADVWYKFQANATKMFVSAQGNGDIDLALEVLDGCGGSTLQCLNNTGAGAAEVASLSGLSIGTYYYFRVYNAAGSAPVTQTFKVSVSYIPTVQLESYNCGIDDYTTNDIIKSIQPVNTAAIVYYQFRFQELDAPFNTYEVMSQTPTNPNLRLKFFNEIQYGRSYEVSVRLAVNPNATVGDYGPSCTIKLQDDVLPTQLEEQYSNGFFSFCDVIGCDDVGGADRYRWQFYDLQNLSTVYGDGDERLLRMSKIPGLKLGKTYIVTVFAEVNGMTSDAGTSRFLYTNNFVPNTGLRNDIYPCGATYPLNTQVQAVEVCKAQTYTWRFKNTSQAQPDLIYTRTGGNRFIRFEWVTGLIAGDSYDLDVKARQGNKNGDYSTVCNITIGAPVYGFASQSSDLISSVEGNSESFQGLNTNHPESAIEITILNNGGSATSGLIMDVSSSDVDQNVQFQLFDLSGKLIAERKDFVQYEGSRIEWQIPGFSSGIYLLKAMNGDHVITKKVSVF